MVATCLCGTVSVKIDKTPDYIHDCNCTLCRKSGGAWGYFTNENIHVVGDTSSVMRTDKENPAAQVHSCRKCSTTTHFEMAKSFTDAHGPIDMVGVNMRLFDIDDLQGVEVRFPNGRDWAGSGAFDYRRPSTIIGGKAAW